MTATSPAPALTEGAGGLTDAEVADRVRRGLTNSGGEGPARRVSDIVRANVMTRFNAILAVLLGVIIVVGPAQDGLFGLVLVLNTAIGILQELRARRTLAKLELLDRTPNRVVRNGRVSEVTVDDIVLDDVVELARGEQVPADGVVVSGSFEMDESLLTGEAEPIDRQPGDEMLSGTFVVAGSGRMRVTQVGSEALARSLTEEARRFAPVKSELRAGVDAILRLVQWGMVPTALILVTGQLRTLGLADALRGTVAGVGAMIPEGLVLLTSVAFAVAVIRLGRQRVVTNELAAVEGLARVDVVCLDKTGTLTEGDMAVLALEPLGGTSREEVDAALASLASGDEPPNPTLAAITACLADRTPVAWPAQRRVPFSSARKWMAVWSTDHGTWVLGGADVVGAGEAEAAVAEHAARGRRVLLLARGDIAIDPGDVASDSPPPTGLVPAGLIVLEERLRPDAADTIRYFLEQGMTVKVVSGDSPATVGAIAARAGIPGADHPVDARGIDATDPSTIEAASVFGRVSPHQKRDMVAALKSKGHTVAMTGDGVNDVVALKEADIGVAMGSGTPAARSVAQFVLLDNAFAVLPDVVGEGRRVIGNVERVANLFVTKTVYAMLLSLSVGVANVPFPFLPRHLTIISTLTIGAPAFFLALSPSVTRFRRGFLGRVLRFAVPAGIVAAAVTFVAYRIARSQPGVSLLEARTAATITLFIIGMTVLVILERPMTGPRYGLTAAMIAGFLLVLTVPALQDFFSLQLPSLIVFMASLGVAGLGVTALIGGWAISAWTGRWWNARRAAAVLGSGSR